MEKELNMIFMNNMAKYYANRCWSDYEKLDFMQNKFSLKELEVLIDITKKKYSYAKETINFMEEVKKNMIKSSAK